MSENKQTVSKKPPGIEKMEDQAREHNSVALGTFKNSKGEWYVVQIKYDGESGSLGEISMKLQGYSREEAVTRFKITAAELILDKE